MDVRRGLASRRGTENNAAFPIILWGAKTASPHDAAIGLLQEIIRGVQFIVQPPFFCVIQFLYFQYHIEV